MFDPIFSTILQRPFYYRHQLLAMTGLDADEFAALRFPQRSHPEAFIFTATEFTEILALNSTCDLAIQDCLDFFASSFTSSAQPLPSAPRIFFTKEEVDRIFYGMPVNLRRRPLKTLDAKRPLYYSSTVHLCLYAAIIAGVPYQQFARLYNNMFSKIFSLGMFSFFIEWVSGLDLIRDIAEAVADLPQGRFAVPRGGFAPREALTPCLPEESSVMEGGLSVFNIQQLLLDELEPAHA